MRDHTKLRAFELADELVLSIYRATRSFPREEIYCLTAQMRRAAISVVSNIVEGCSRESQAEYAHLLGVSFGSLREVHYQFVLATRLGYIRSSESATLEAKFNETEKVLGALVRSMRANPKRNPT